MLISKLVERITKRVEDMYALFHADTKQDLTDPRDLEYNKIYSNDEIPQRLSFIKLVGMIENQGIYSSCVGQTAEVMKRIHENPEGGLRPDGWPLTYQNFSAYIFYKLLCKTHDGIPDSKGTYPRTAMKMLHKFGIPEEKYGTYPETLDAEWQPRAGWERNALQYRIGAYARCMTIEEMVNAIANKGPLLCGSLIHKSFYDSIGMIAMPKSGDKAVGGHAYARVGYDLERQAFQIVNSWGSDWGHNGCAWESFEFAEEFTQDCWVSLDREDEDIAGLIRGD